MYRPSSPGYKKYISMKPFFESRNKAAEENYSLLLLVFNFFYIFHLLDHLLKWLRLTRKQRRRKSGAIVEGGLIGQFAIIFFRAIKLLEQCDSGSSTFVA